MNKAHNTLKKIANIPHSEEYWKEYERTYILLAKNYIERHDNNGNRVSHDKKVEPGCADYDLARDLCNRCLDCNQSCAYAWELLGHIHQEQGEYHDAVQSFRKSWDTFMIGHQRRRNSLSLGWKMATICMKVGELEEAIDVATQLCDLYPEYSMQIEREILSNCFLNLRQ